MTTDYVKLAEELQRFVVKLGTVMILVAVICTIAASYLTFPWELIAVVPLSMQVIVFYVLVSRYNLDTIVVVKESDSE